MRSFKFVFCCWFGLVWFLFLPKVLLLMLSLYANCICIWCIKFSFFLLIFVSGFLDEIRLFFLFWLSMMMMIRLSCVCVCVFKGNQVIYLQQYFIFGLLSFKPEPKNYSFHFNSSQILSIWVFFD